MGDIAEMLLSGLLDSETGELIDGDAPGFPRSGAYRHGHGQDTRPRCPHCNRKLKSEQGVRDHIRDVHAK